MYSGGVLYGKKLRKGPVLKIVGFRGDNAGGIRCGYHVKRRDSLLQMLLRDCEKGQIATYIYVDAIYGVCEIFLGNDQHLPLRG